MPTTRSPIRGLPLPIVKELLDRTFEAMSEDERDRFTQAIGRATYARWREAYDPSLPLPAAANAVTEDVARALMARLPDTVIAAAQDVAETS